MTKITYEQLCGEIINKNPSPKIAEKYNLTVAAICIRLRKMGYKYIKGELMPYTTRIKNNLPLNERRKIYGKTYYEKHREEVNRRARERGRRNRKTKKGKAREAINSLRRYKRRYGIIHDFKTKDWIEKLQNSFGVCKRCNKYVGIKNLTLDHIIPLKRAINIPNFVYTINDVQPLCRPCNSTKSAKIEGISSQILNLTNWI